MIAYLSGKIINTLPGEIILKTPSGVGYSIFVDPAKNFLTNENLDIYVWSIGKDNNIDLFGFAEFSQRQWAKKLHKVPGIGPKTAASIIYNFGIAEILRILRDGDYKALSGMKGLGVKTAKKVILELKGEGADIAIQTIEVNDTQSQQMAIDFTDTLSNLGYKRGDIVSVISKLKQDGIWDKYDLVKTVKEALRYLSKK